MVNAKIIFFVSLSLLMLLYCGWLEKIEIWYFSTPVKNPSCVSLPLNISLHVCRLLSLLYCPLSLILLFAVFFDPCSSLILFSERLNKNAE